jgi:tetratricopeptide (TPR) repeat protein
MRPAFSALLPVALSFASQACSVETGSPSGPPLPPQDEQTAPVGEEATGRPTSDGSRGMKALEGEVAALEKRFESLPVDSPDRAVTARELAERNAALEGAAFREKMQANVAHDAYRESDAGAVMLRARAAAVSYYGVIVHDYPKYSQLDEVFYYLAYEYEQADDTAHARKAYFDLIQRRPDSKYVPNAYLAFGELFFNESASDPSKRDLARSAYTKVLDYPPPKNAVYGYAWYKLAYVYWNGNELDQALAAFKKTIDFGVAYPDLPNAAKLADSARRDVIPVYALAGRPTAAYEFLRELSADRSDAKTFKMMVDLGQTYVSTGHYPEALALYEDLLGRAPRIDVSAALGQLVSVAEGSGDGVTANGARALLGRL